METAIDQVLHDVNNHLMLALNHLATGNADAARRSIEACGRLTRNVGVPAGCTRSSLIQLLLGFPVEPPAGIRIAYSIGPDAPELWMNTREIERAVTNLLFNAFDALQQGGTVTIGVNGQEIWVSDTGAGIAPELHGKIFECGYSTKGSGLGLAMVRDIMRKHGGTVRVESTPGNGATFTLWFPTR